MSDSTYAFPASFAQQRLWFVDRLLPGNPFYNLHAAVPLGAVVDPAVMARALNTIIERHETLRTSFRDDRGTPVQIVHPHRAIDLPVVDLRGRAPHERRLELRRLSTAQAEEPFDLSTAPLLRAALIELAADEFVLLLTIHHIVADGWSLGIWMREIQEIYGAYALGRACPLPPLPIQYADFTLWQREWLQGQALETQLDYWRHQLDGVPVLDLPIDRRRPRIAAFRGASVEFQLDGSLQRTIAEVSRSNGVTPFMFLLACFKALLHRYTGQTDIVVGSPIANRTRAEVEGLIGFFVNTLVLRTQLDDDPDVVTLLRRVRDTTLGAYAHQDLPFEKLVEELRPERDLSRNPLVQVMFQLHNAPTLAVVNSADTVSAPQASRGISAFDLAVDVWETRQGLVGRIDYGTDLFEPATVQRFAAHFTRLVESAATHPRARLSQLAILDDEARAETPGAPAPSDYPRDATIHQLFEACATDDPTAVALAFGAATMTYGALNAHADRIAATLSSSVTSGPGIVGIAIERSFDMVAGLLGILKGGFAYLALDLALPSKRLRLLVEQAGLRYVLCSGRDAARIASIGCDPVVVDQAGTLEGAEPVTSGRRVSAGDLAYIAYTSGSTGVPKGVCVPHRAVVRLVRQRTYVEWSARDVFFQFSPLSFDASTFEIWGSLLNGARLAIHEPGAASLEELGRSIERHGVTTLWLTSGLFNQMVDTQLPRLASVEQLLTGGDVVSAAHVRKALEARQGRTLVNGYGPTEGTTFTACARITQVSEVQEPVPIGRPLAGTQVHVLDGSGHPVPTGVAGELFIGGDGVALGYVNAPELTAERFVPNHLTGGPDLLYRTGDRVRWRGDGQLEFLGRIDRQLKLRGFRVEPGEVEASLTRHPEIADAAVVVRGEGARRQLVAYIVPRSAPLSLSVVREHLEQDLPAFMVPSALVPMAELPVTQNGKLDEARLPAPATIDDGALERAFCPPSSDLEVALAGIWCEVLQLDRVDVHANFFTELAGHSLLATQVVSRMRERFDVDLPLRDFFESPTISRLAVCVEERLIAEIASMSDERASALLAPGAGLAGAANGN